MTTRLYGSSAMLFFMVLFYVSHRTEPTFSKQALTSIEICTNTDWYEPSTDSPAVIQSSGPATGSIHDIANAEPIWGKDVSPNSSSVLTKEFVLPEGAININGSIKFVADDGVTLFLNSVELGNYDALVWPPPEYKILENLGPGKNLFRAEVYNRPGHAWFEACAYISYETSGARDVYLPFVGNNHPDVATSTPSPSQTAEPTMTPTPTNKPSTPTSTASVTPSPTQSSTPTSTPTNTPTPTSTPQLDPADVPILLLAYYPPDPNNSEYLDPEETGIANERIFDVQNRVQSMAVNGIDIISDATRYRGYGNSTAPVFLNYYVFHQQEYFYAMPRGHQLPWGPYRPNYGLIMRDIDVCNYVDTNGVKEVWIYGYHSSFIEPDESKMSSKYGDISNAWPKDEYINEEFRLPRCANSYVMYNFNYGRGVETNIHNRIHQIESVISYADIADTIFWNDFSELVFQDTTHNYFSSCGNAHYTPNWSDASAHAYQYALQGSRKNNCETWHPNDNQTTYVSANCSQWDCSEVQFYKWFMQNMPGYNNGIQHEDKTMRNWWEAMYDFNHFIDAGRGLYSPN